MKIANIHRFLTECLARSSELGRTSEGRPETEFTRAEWDSVVAESVSPTFFHTWTWKNFLEMQGYKSQYVLIKDKLGDVVGACPFFLMPRRDSFWSLQSLPESAYGGPILSDPMQVRPVSSGTLRYFKNLPLRRRVSEVRVITANDALYREMNVSGSKVRHGTAHMMIDLEKRPADVIWNEFHGHRDKRKREKIRQMEREGFEFGFATQGGDINRLHQLHSQTLEASGKHPKKPSFFADLWNTLHPENFQVAKTTFQGVVVGVQTFFVFAPVRTLYLAYNGVDKGAAGSRSCDLFLRWKIIQWASESGFHRLVSPTSSNPSNRYHRQWSQFGPEFIQVYRLSYSVLPRLHRTLRRLQSVRRSLGIQARQAESSQGREDDSHEIGAHRAPEENSQELDNE